MPTKTFTIGTGKTQYDCWELLKYYWGKKDLETAEAICILAAKNQTNIVNTKVDFFSREFDMRYTPLNDILTKEEMARRFGAVQNGIFEVPIIRTMTATDNLFGTIDEAVDMIADLFGTEVQKRINWSSHQKAARQLVKIVDKKVIKHMTDSLKRAKHKIGYGPGSRTAKSEINEIIKNVKQYENKTEGELYSMIFDTLSASKTAYIDRLFKDPELEANMQMLVDCLKEWITKIKIVDFLDGCREYNQTKVIQRWQQDFTDYIQKTIFKDLTYDKEYSESQHIKFQDSLKSTTNLMPHLPRTGIEYRNNVTLIHATALKIPTDFYYIRDHWLWGQNSNSIYGEQINIWLAANQDNFYRSNITGFAWQDVTNISNY